jgi:TRAP-type transport system periplasmic protein
VATYSAWKLWGVMPHMVKANLFYGNINYMINKRKFETLSAPDQAAVLAAARESEVWLKPEYEKSVDTSIADAVKQGGTVTSVAPAQRKAMVDAIAAKWKVEVDKDCGVDMANKVRALFSKHAL